MNRCALFLITILFLVACSKDEENSGPDFNGFYSVNKLVYSQCPQAANNRELTADTKGICLQTATNETTCIRIELTIAGTTYELKTITTKTTGGITLSTPATDKGMVTINGKNLTLCTPSQTCIDLIGNDSGSQLEWDLETTNCKSVYVFTKQS